MLIRMMLLAVFLFGCSSAPRVGLDKVFDFLDNGPTDFSSFKKQVLWMKRAGYGVEVYAQIERIWRRVFAAIPLRVKEQRLANVWRPIGRTLVAIACCGGERARSELVWFLKEGWKTYAGGKRQIEEARSRPLLYGVAIVAYSLLEPDAAADMACEALSEMVAAGDNLRRRRFFSDVSCCIAVALRKPKRLFEILRRAGMFGANPGFEEIWVLANWPASHAGSLLSLLRQTYGDCLPETLAGALLFVGDRRLTQYAWEACKDLPPPLLSGNMPPGLPPFAELLASLRQVEKRIDQSPKLVYGWVVSLLKRLREIPTSCVGIPFSLYATGLFKSTDGKSRLSQFCRRLLETPAFIDIINCLKRHLDRQDFTKLTRLLGRLRAIRVEGKHPPNAHIGIGGEQ